MVKFSIIVPVFNRPDEINELLKSLTQQVFKDFEVLIVEDGSTLKCEEVTSKYESLLELKYYYKENTGQGFSRNYGSERATGQWLVFYDSDCVIPPSYLLNLEHLVNQNSNQAFSGPDASRKDFSNLQKAISFSMTSFLTTGGIRGRKMKVDNEAHLRSYNLVMKKEVFNTLEGFKKTNMGEDMELSYRFRMNGYKALISEDLKVYHKRRTTFRSFFKQIFSFGRTRIQLKRHYSIPIKIAHLFPAVFTIGFFFSMIGPIVLPSFFYPILILYIVYFILIFISASISEKSFQVGVFSVVTSMIQHIAYGLGFLKEGVMSSRH